MQQISVHLTEWILLFIIILLITIYIISQRKFLKLSWQLPGPFLLPIVGNAMEFICKDEDIFERCNDLVRRYPSPMRVWLGPKFLIVFSKIEHIDKIMSSMKFATKDNVYKFIQQFDGEFLISGSGLKWKKDRRLMSHIFLKKNVEKYFPQMLYHTKKFVKKLEVEVDRPTFNIEDYINKCTTDIVNETIIGIRTNAQDGKMDKLIKQMRRMYEVVHARIVKVWLQFDCIYRLTSYWKEHEEGKRDIHGFMRRALYMAREKHTRSEERLDEPKSFLESMLDIMKEHPNFATDQEMDHHLTTLYSASEDTTTSICCFTLVLLGMYPNIQNKIMEEIYDVIGKDKRDVELEDLSKLEYLEMCIKDVLRLFPIAPYIMRVASEDVQIGKYLIPKGCSTVISIQALHRDPELWEKPNDFYPEHFLEDAVKNRSTFSFMPFSAGPRGCLGKPYAYMALKVILVAALQEYVFEADGCLQDKKLKTDISVRFKDDQYPVRIKKRSSL